MSTTPRHTLIGLTGYAGVGKDTVCRLAQAMMPPGAVHRLALADELKADVAARHDTTVEDINRHKADWRTILQEWGTEKRAIDPLYWVKLLGARFQALPPGSFVFVTDIRYPNEAQWVTANGGTIVRVDRPGFGPVNDHSSENMLDGIAAAWRITNAGDETIRLDVAAMLDALHWTAGHPVAAVQAEMQRTTR